MSFTSVRRRLWPLNAWRPSDEVSRDAAELIRLWGVTAYEHASALSWQEDTGLLATSKPGHWWRVRREIGRRHGRADQEPKAEFAA